MPQKIMTGVFLCALLGLPFSFVKGSPSWLGPVMGAITIGSLIGAQFVARISKKRALRALGSPWAEEMTALLRTRHPRALSGLLGTFFLNLKLEPWPGRGVPLIRLPHQIAREKNG